MKEFILSLVAMATISLSSFGQAPEGFKYQAVLRDAGNLILNNQAVGMRMTIQQGSIGGATVYQETFAPTTNAYGLVNLEIGNGTVVSGDFTTIDWGLGPYFIETAADVTGGTSYVIMGTSQLMSVPYALYAETSGSSIPGPQGPAGNDGIDGAMGPQGPQGLPGNDGADGIDGAMGPQGPQGLPGNDGTDGIDGAMGPQGPQGLPGNDGADGIDGAMGPQGPQGLPGNDGADGIDGAMGPQGTQGLPGNDGADGIDGAMGPQGPQGLPGNDGQGGVTTAGSNVIISGTGTAGDPYIINATDNVNDADSDPANEIQTLSLSGSDLTISGANTVTLPGGSGAFSTTSNLTSNAPGDYTNDDFLFGSPSLNDDTDPNHDRRLFFDKSKGAFRAGIVYDNKWDAANVGNYSSAFGDQDIASGESSFAAGSQNSATGLRSVAIGTGVTASGSYSMGFGQGSATGLGSMMLKTGQAIGANSLAIGGTSQGPFSVAFGYGPESYGTQSMSIGKWTRSYAYAETVLGSANASSGGNAGTWVSTDRLFVIGNGIDGLNRSDALLMLKNGNTTLHGALTIDADNVGGATGYTLPGQDGNSGDVMVTDGAGNVSWQAGGVSNPYIQMHSEAIGQVFPIGWTAIDFNSVSLNSGITFNSITDYITFPEDGTYEITVSYRTGAGADDWTALRLYGADGSPYGYSNGYGNGSAGNQTEVTFMVQVISSMDYQIQLGRNTASLTILASPFTDIENPNWPSPVPTIQASIKKIN